MSKDTEQHPHPHHHELLDLFDELSFPEMVKKVTHGLRQPKTSGEYKYAKLQMLRLWSPASAFLVPALAVALMVALGSGEQTDRAAVQVEIMEPEAPPELDEIKPDDEPLPPPEPIDMEFTDVSVATDVAVPGPITPQAFSPQPAAIDSVAMVKSPIVMKGIIGSRAPGQRGKALAEFGGSGITEGAVLRALRWLKKNQQSDGSWAKTKPAMTGMALLAFLAHGETPASDEFGPTVERGIKYLVDSETANGHFAASDGNEYSLPIAAYALCEAYTLTKVPILKEKAQLAMDVIIKGQNPTGGWNYRCSNQPGEGGAFRDDTSYMGWCAQALKAALIAGLENEGIQECRKKAIKGFQKNALPTGGFGYTGPSAGGLTGVGVLCMQLLGASKEAECRNGLQWLEQATFRWSEPWLSNPIYYWYYCTQAKFHAGGDTWSNWNKMFAIELVRNQKVLKGAGDDGKDIGFWEPPNGVKGHTDGEVQDTCLCVLQLQVYYRYLPTFRQPKVEEEEESTGGDIEVDVKLQTDLAPQPHAEQAPAANG